MATTSSACIAPASVHGCSARRRPSRTGTLASRRSSVDRRLGPGLLTPLSPSPAADRGTSASSRASTVIGRPLLACCDRRDGGGASPRGWKAHLQHPKPLERSLRYLWCAVRTRQRQPRQLRNSTRDLLRQLDSRFLDAGSLASIRQPRSASTGSAPKLTALAVNVRAREHDGPYQRLHGALRWPRAASACLHYGKQPCAVPVSPAVSAAPCLCGPLYQLLTHDENSFWVGCSRASWGSFTRSSSLSVMFSTTRPRSR